MDSFSFEDMREAVKNPQQHEIVKIEVIDGAEITLYEGSYSPLHLGPDPQNDDRPTLWYTTALKEQGEPLTVQLRWFLEGQNVTPRLHHFVGSCAINGDVWFLFLDRTRRANQENAEMRDALRTASQDINKFVTEILETADEDRDMSKEDFLRRLFDSIEHNEEGE